MPSVLTRDRVVVTVGVLSLAAVGTLVYTNWPSATSTASSWWTKLSFKLLYSPQEAILLQKLERVSLAIENVRSQVSAALQEYQKSKSDNEGIPSPVLKQLLEAGVDIDYLFSVLDKEDFSSSSQAVKQRKKVLVNACNDIAKNIDAVTKDAQS